MWKKIKEHGFYIGWSFNDIQLRNWWRKHFAKRRSGDVAKTYGDIKRDREISVDVVKNEHPKDS